MKLFNWFKKSNEVTSPSMCKCGKKTAPTPINPNKEESDNSFSNSVAIGIATDSAALGGLVGGDLIGGIIGQEIADSFQSDDYSSSFDSSSSSDFTGGGGDSGGGGSSGDW